ncbi:unnamed protein product [Haemonchus placei]|uniref:Galectin n=1 Tax=Haemonchus placei TaxID=6290 RepID=A0A0N4WSD8_HAEPC|nr:unnamed protein product [Haemonchus placei]
MASFLRRFFGPKKPRLTRKDSITGRNKTLFFILISGISFPVFPSFKGRECVCVEKRDPHLRFAVTSANVNVPRGVPYLSRLEGNQLQPGQSLIVRGVITGTDSFVVNLTSGPIVEAEEGGEILDNRLLSIRCDISKNRICFNACVDGEWGK